MDSRFFDYDEEYSLPGAHLASGNVYREVIVNLENRNKNLRHRDWKVPFAQRNAEVHSRVKILTFGTDSKSKHTSQTFDSGGLREFLETHPRTTTPPGVRRIYLLEGTNPDYVEVFGSYFNIDPMIFMRHQRTSLWEGRHRAGNTPPLASTEDLTKSFMIEYCELIYFVDGCKGPSMRSPSDNRNIDSGIKMNNSSDVDRVGILHRKASFWSQRHPGGGWDSIIILDPPLPAAGPPNMHKILVGNLTTAKFEMVCSELYQGGYVDFINYTTLDEALLAKGPPRTSMMDDLCFYWKTQPNYIELNDDPLVTTIFLQKIIASNYMLLVEYLRSLLSEIEFDISRTDNYEGFRHDTLNIAQKWTILHIWTRRFPQYMAMVDNILSIHNYPARPDNWDWNKCRMDFEVIEKKLYGLRQRSDTIANSFNSLSSLASSLASLHNMDQSLEEAKNVKILTFLAIFFLPLSYISSLFSMGDTYGPEGHRFWLYCAVSFPISFLVILATVIFIYTRGIVNFKAILSYFLRER